MKKGSVMLVCVGCALSFAACGKTAAGETGEKILQEMEEVNANDALVEKYGRVAFNTTYFYPDGETVHEHYYMDAERYVMENEYWMYIDEAGDVYGFDYEADVAFRYLFAGDSYQEFAAEEYLAGYTYDETETVTAQEEKEGHLILYTELEERALIQQWEEALLLEEESISKLKCTYEVDAQSYEIYAIKNSMVMADGEEKDYSLTERVEDPEIYVVDEQLRATVYDGEQRTVTLIENAGTDKEQIYTQTASWDSVVQIYLPADAKQDLYKDAACTTLYEGTEERDGDAVLYYLR